MAKTALITGTSRGIGAALKKEFESRNYTVLGHRRDEHGDLRESGTIQFLFEWARDQGVCILINCAGIYSGGAINEVTKKEIADVIDVNLICTMWLTYAIWPLLVERKGTLININSVAGRIPMGANEIAYRVSKYGLTGFSHVMSYQGFKDNVRVVDVPFGGVNTDMLKGKRKDMEVPELQPSEAAKLVATMSEQSAFENEEIHHRLVKGNGTIIDNGYMLENGGRR